MLDNIFKILRSIDELRCRQVGKQRTPGVLGNVMMNQTYFLSQTAFQAHCSEYKTHFNILDDRDFSIHRAIFYKSFSNINPSVEIQSSMTLAASGKKTYFSLILSKFSAPTLLEQYIVSIWCSSVKKTYHDLNFSTPCGLKGVVPE